LQRGSVDARGPGTKDEAGDAENENEADSNCKIKGHRVDPAGGVGEILANPEEKNGGDNGELAGDNEEGMSPLTALVEQFDLVGGEIALFGWKEGIGHQSLLGRPQPTRLAAGSSLFRFNHMRAAGFYRCAGKQVDAAANCSVVKIRYNGCDVPYPDRTAVRRRFEKSSTRSRFTQEGEGLEASDFKRLAATDIYAGELVVAPDHVRLRFGKPGAVAFVRMAGKLGALTTNDPGDLVVAGLPALGAGEVVSASFGGLVEKIPFFHVAATPLIEEALPWKTPRQSLAR